MCNFLIRQCRRRERVSQTSVTRKVVQTTGKVDPDCISGFMLCRQYTTHQNANPEHQHYRNSVACFILYHIHMILRLISHPSHYSQ